MAVEEREVYVVTICLGGEDKYGNETDMELRTEHFYADTLEEAEKMKEIFLSGKHWFYGDSINCCSISNKKEKVEFLVHQRSR